MPAEQPDRPEEHCFPCEHSARGTAGHMLTHASLISDLEDAIANGSADRRSQALERVTDLFVQRAEHYTGAQLSLFDDVIGRLAAEIEVKARAKLASRIARLANAPHRLVRTLAFDDAVEVAEPVLTGSPVLNDQDLLDNARTKSQGHMLAISRRRALSETVTDVLVTRGDRQVARTVAQNAGARFSNAGFRALVRRSTGDDALAEHVGQRADIPRALFITLVEQASDGVRKKLIASNPAADRVVDQAVSEVVGRIKAEAGHVAADHAAALAVMRGRKREGGLGEDDLYAFAREKRVSEVTAALAVLSDLPVELADSAMQDERPDVLLIIARACEFSWTTVKMILLMRGAGRVSVQELDRALVGFERLQVATAKRVVTFYKSRSAAGRDAMRAAAPRESGPVRLATAS